MSADAQRKLAAIWEKLHFAYVKRTFVRDPEDILMISRVDQHGGYVGPHGAKRLKDVPKAERSRVDVAWRYYYGFTTDDIYFQKDDYNELDLEIDLSMTYGESSNHTSGYDKPMNGQLICGEVVDTPKGKRFHKWFICDEAFKLLVTAVREGTDLSEDDLGRRLLTDDFPDKYWAITRLVLFDNVQAFVNNCRYSNVTFERVQAKQRTPDWAKHPAAGMTYGKRGFQCIDGGMWLPVRSAEYVHRMSHYLDQPQWWQEFLRLAEEQNVAHSHPGIGGMCIACEMENYDRGVYPDWEYGWREGQFPYSEEALRRKLQG
jgi:hypothetical protein